MADWPAPLRDAVSLMLAAPLPMVLFWGSDLIALYNDAYARAIGDRHPAALGGKGSDKWAHIWDVIGPILTDVRATGEPVLIGIIYSRPGARASCGRSARRLLFACKSVRRIVRRRAVHRL